MSRETLKIHEVNRFKKLMSEGASSEDLAKEFRLTPAAVKKFSDEFRDKPAKDKVRKERAAKALNDAVAKLSSTGREQADQ